MSRFVMLLACSSPLLALYASAADLTFTGNLRFVSASALTVRLSNGIIIDARLPKAGELAASSIAAQYKFADQVRVACKHISAVWDKSVTRMHTLELTRMDLIRSAQSAQKEEMAQVRVSLSWYEGENLLRPVPEEPKPAKAINSEALERACEVNLARAAKMPNFTADEQAIRSVRGDSVKWKQVDTVESEIAFHGDDPTRQKIRINGKPYKTVSRWIPGVNWDVGFGDEIHALLDRDCGNTFELAGREGFRGKHVTVYRFSAPADGCFGPETYGYQQYAAAKTGRVLVDETDGNVLVEIEYKDIGTPPELGGGIERSYSWDYVKIGDSTYLLPVATDFIWTFPKGAWHIAAQFKNHRHFEASTDVTFK